jgi:hypothetical protein
MFTAVLNVVLPCGISGSHGGEYEDFNENTRRYIPEWLSSSLFFRDRNCWKFAFLFEFLEIFLCLLLFSHIQVVLPVVHQQHTPFAKIMT